jgi:hypothetical protein
MFCMSRAWSLALLASLACPSFAQSSSAGPLGVLVRPPKSVRVPLDLRPAIPTKSVVRLIQATQFTSDGENVVIYETGNEYEPNAHIAVIKNHTRVADFGLVELFAKDGVGESYALFQSAQLPLGPSRKGFVAAFRNTGDGARTLFVLITESGGQFRVSWQKWASEAQFQARGGGVFRLWDADEDDDCVWCPHHYEVTNYLWKDETLSKISHFSTKHILSPYQFSEKPIRIVP